MLLFFLLVPLKLSIGCGPGPYVFEGYSFLKPETINIEADLAPFFLDFEAIWEHYESKEHAQRNDNLKEWQERFCGVPTIDDLEDIIYDATVDDMGLLKSAIALEKTPLPSKMARNTFAKYLDRNKCYEAIDYLIYAKKCQPYVQEPNLWNDNKRYDKPMEAFMNNGKKAFKKTDSHYFKLRYAYQIIRLAHYGKKYEQVLELYDYFMPKIDNDTSTIEYWILGHKAGAMMSLGQNVEASYLFSQVFDKCPGKRESAFRSFKIKTDEEWKACMLLCQDDRERATLHILRAHASHSNIIEELDNIYQLDPKNENLELLLLRQIKKLEKDLLGIEFNDKKKQNLRYANIPRKQAGEEVIDLQLFVSKVLEERLVVRPDFWKLAEGYLELLAGDYYQAARTFEVARKMIDDKSVLQEQLKVFELVLKICALDHIDNDVEIDLAEIIAENKLYDEHEDFTDLIDDKLAWLYDQSGNPGKAFLAHYSIKDMVSNPQDNIILDLLEICRKDTLNELEKEMVLDRDGDSVENDLIYMRATMLFDAYQIETALRVLKEMDRTNWDNYHKFYPFEERIQDCVHCPVPDTLKVNKGELIENLIDMELRARAEADEYKAALIYYRMGIAYYNMTYCGYAWNAMDSFRSGSSLSKYTRRDGDIVAHSYYPFGNKEHFDCSRALFYFEKARILAGTTGLGARATFMAAKCKYNEYHAYKDRARNYEYFDMLRKQYSETEFYQQIIKECKYFSDYVARYEGM